VEQEGSVNTEIIKKFVLKNKKVVAAMEAHDPESAAEAAQK